MFEIYKIENAVSGKCYVGQTRKGVENRFKQHCNKNNKSILGLAIAKYGAENFRVCVLGVTDTQSEANELEEFYINKCETVTPKGYNANRYGRLVGNLAICNADVTLKISSIMWAKIIQLGNADLKRVVTILSSVGVGNKIYYGNSPQQFIRSMDSLNTRIVKLHKKAFNKFLANVGHLDLFDIRDDYIKVASSFVTTEENTKIGEDA